MSRRVASVGPIALLTPMSTVNNDDFASRQRFHYPRELKQQPDPPYVADLLENLDGLLEDLMLPPLDDRTPIPRTNGTQMCVVYLSLPDERLSPILAGGATAPHTVFLCLAHTWISRVGDDLWLHQGVSSDAAGQLYMDRFDPPRRVTYFANFFTEAASYRTHNEGEQFFSSTLRTPTSSSPMLEKLVNDKLYTRTLLARGLVSFPATLSFSFQNDTQYRIRKVDLERIRIVPTFRNREGNTKRIHHELTLYTKNLFTRTNGECRRIVVKPSGPMWMESKGVKFFDIDDVDGATDHVEKLLMGYDCPVEESNHGDPKAEHLKAYPGDSILCEEFLSTMPMHGVITEREAGMPNIGGAAFELVNGVEAQIALQTLTYDKADGQLGLDDLSGVAVDVGYTPLPTQGPGQSADIPPTGPKLQSIAGEKGDNVLADAIAQGIDDNESGAGAHLQTMHVRPLAFRLRCIVALDGAGRPAVAGMICGIGPADKPLNGTNTVPATLDMVLEQWGLQDSVVATRLKNSIMSEGERVLRVIHDAEEQMTAEQRGARNAYTDVIGIDFLLAQRSGMVVPFVIEVNDHDCFFAMQQVEQIIPDLQGNSMSAWLQRQTTRSQQYLLEDTVVVIVGAGGWSKAFLWDTCNEWGVKVVLVEHDAKHFAREKVWRFIHYPDLTKHVNDEANAAKIADLVRQVMAADDTVVRGSRYMTSVDAPCVNGVLTFWEDATVLACHVAKALNCVANDPEAQAIVKNKTKCLEHLANARMRSAYLPRPGQFAAKVARILSEADLESAIAQVPLPAVLKTEYGSSAVGVKLVSTPEEVVVTYRNVQKTLATEDAHMGVGLGFNEGSTPMLLMEFLDGTEHDVDIVMFEGELVAAFVTDNAPTRLPYFCETAAVMPSQLSTDKTSLLAFAAHHVVRATGLRTGVFNVEMKYTSTGPRLIEVNGRMGGFYIRDWVRRLYGVDLVRCAFLCSFGVRPAVPARLPQTSATLIGLMLYSSQQKESLRQVADSGTLKRLADREIAVVNIFEPHVPEEMEYEEPYGNLAIAGATVTDAGQKLIAMVRTLGLDTYADPSPEYYLRALGAQL